MEMFRPNLTLTSEPDREFTLHAVTLAPNSCYSAGRPRAEVPPTVRLLPEVFPVILPVHMRKGRCLMVLTPLRYRLRNLELGAAFGKTTVTAFAMCGDQILGSASVPVTASHECSPGATPVDSSDWFAWVNRMPPGPGSFHVTGTVTMPTPGYDVALKPATPQGINPQELILDLIVTERPGTWPQVLTPMTVRYDQQPYEGNYSGVLVRIDEDDAVHLDVQDVF